MTENTNPLGKYYRQPARSTSPCPARASTIPEVFTPTETGEIPIANDSQRRAGIQDTGRHDQWPGHSGRDQELCAKLKNPWKMVNYDTDAVLLAIRIATYGETMDVNFKVPVVTNEDITHH